MGLLLSPTGLYLQCVIFVLPAFVFQLNIVASHTCTVTVLFSMKRLVEQLSIINY